MLNSCSCKALADINTKIQNKSSSNSDTLAMPSSDIQEELSTRTLHKIKKMSKKNNRLSKNIKKQINSFKEASKFLVDVSADHSSNIIYLNDEMSCIKKNITDVFNESQGSKNKQKLFDISEKLEILQIIQVQINYTNQRVIESQREIFNKELENLELKRRLEQVEDSISMYFTEKENQCKCSVF